MICDTRCQGGICQRSAGFTFARALGQTDIQGPSEACLTAWGPWDPLKGPVDPTAKPLEAVGFYGIFECKVNV